AGELTGVYDGPHPGSHRGLDGVVGPPPGWLVTHSCAPIRSSPSEPGRLARRRTVGCRFGRPVFADPALLLFRPRVRWTHALDRPLVAGGVVDVDLPVESAVTHVRVDGLVDELQQQFAQFRGHRIGDVVDRDPHEVVSRHTADEQRTLRNIVKDDDHIEPGHRHLGKAAGLRGVDVGDGLSESLLLRAVVGAFGAVNVPQWHVLFSLYCVVVVARNLIFALRDRGRTAGSTPRSSVRGLTAATLGETTAARLAHRSVTPNPLWERRAPGRP